MSRSGALIILGHRDSVLPIAPKQAITQSLTYNQVAALTLRLPRQHQEQMYGNTDPTALVRNGGEFYPMVMAHIALLLLLEMDAAWMCLVQGFQMEQTFKSTHRTTRTLKSGFSRHCPKRKLH